MSIKIKIFFITIFIFVIVMIGTIVFYSYNSEITPNNSPSDLLPTLYPTLHLTSPPPSPTIINRSHLNTLMPIKQNEFTIEYLYSSDTFVITVTLSPYEENKQKAENWIRNNGINDLSTINILYGRGPLVE